MIRNVKLEDIKELAPIYRQRDGEFVYLTLLNLILKLIQKTQKTFA